MNELLTITGLVKTILETDPKARNSDNYLYSKVLEHEALSKGIDLYRITVPVFYAKAHEWNFTGFETVRRTRQKVQRAFPELAGDESVRRNRATRREVFKAYSNMKGL